MKKIGFLIMALAALLNVACLSENENQVCRIEGQLTSDKWDGKNIFLVPLKHTDSIGVDSVKVEGDKFVIETKNTNLMSVIRMDFHFRYGLEDLLVVTEPGTVSVKIGETSSASGTPQNEKLQVWKEKTQTHNAQRSLFMQAAKKVKNDTVAFNRLKAKADSVYKDYKNYTRQFAKDLDEGTLREFLSGMFPTSVQTRLPDGTMQTIELE